MSYEIVKSIKIDEANRKVFINCACNNVRPLDYSNEEYPYFSKILQEKGKQAVEIELLRCFESGTLQSHLNNKYTRALKVLFYLFADEYKKFNWRINNYNDDERNSDEFKALLLKALNTNLPKQKYIVFNKINNGYVRKITSRYVFYCSQKDEAKVFDFMNEAKDSIPEKDFYEVIEK